MEIRKLGSDIELQEEQKEFLDKQLQELNRKLQTSPPGIEIDIYRRLKRLRKISVRNPEIVEVSVRPFIDL
jgi:hypothetical protein